MPDSGITIENIQIKISHESTNAVNGIENLTNALRGLKSVTSSGLRGLTNIAKQIERFSAAVTAMPDLSKLEQLRDVLAQIKGLGNINISRNIQAGGNASADVGNNTSAETINTEAVNESPIGESATEAAEDWSDLGQTARATIQDISDPIERLRVQIELQRIRVQELGETYATLKNAQSGVDNNETVDSGLRYASAQEALDRYRERLMSLAAQAGYTRTQLEKLAEEIGYTGKITTSASKGVSKLAGMFGRATAYGFLFQILTIIKKLISESLQNLAQYSEKANYTLSSLKTMYTQIGNSLAAAFEPLLEIITPILQLFTDGLVETINQINLFFSVLAGRSEMIVATNQWQDYADSVNEAKKSLTGFDEINKLSEQDSTSGMFETIDISDISFGLGLTDIFQTLYEWVTKLSNAIAPLSKAMIKFRVSVLSKILEVLAKLLDALTPIIDACAEIISPISDSLAELITVILDVLTQLLDGILQPIIPIIQLIAEIISSVLNPALIVLEPIIEVISTVLSLIMKLLSPILELINDIVTIALEPLNAQLNGLNGTLDTSNSFLQIYAEKLTGLFDGIFEIVSPLVDYISNVLGDVIGFINNVFAGNWESAWDNITDYFQHVWEGVISFFKGIVNGFLTLLETMVNCAIKIINNITSGLSNLWTWTGIPSIPQIPTVSIPRLADGGFVDSGQLFIAREAGCEMVGTIGTQTAVANNEQIIEGIKQGVIEAMSESGNNQGGDWTIQIVDESGRVKSEQIISAIERRNRRDGKTVISIGG